MSRVNQFQEGYGYPQQVEDVPAKKRKNRRKGFRLPEKVLHAKKEERRGE